ncbi:MAG TPA: DUF349 domain-containing protein [Bacteroides sp.]|nr:DUF349 domain-containing protein [Bacteroides sp.]
MEQNDQVQDGPLTGKSGEIMKDTSKEENSAKKPSEKKEEMVPETTEKADASSVVVDESAIPSPPEEKSAQITFENESTETPPTAEDSPIEPETIEAVESAIETEPEPAPEIKAEDKTEAFADHGADVEADEDPAYKADAKLESQAKSEPEAKSEAEPTPELKAEAETEADPTLELKAEAKPEPEAKSEPEAETEPVPAPELKAEAETEAKPAPELKAEAETEPVPEPELKAETETEPEPEPEAKSEPEAETEAKPEPELKAETETEPEPEPEAKPEPETETEPVTAPELKAEAETEPVPAPELKAETETEPEPAPEAKPEPETEPKPEAKADSKAEQKVKTEKAKSETQKETEPEEVEAKTEADGKAGNKSGEKKPVDGGAKPIPDFDYSDLTREDLVNRLEVLLENQNVQEIRSDIDHIKVNFYKKNKAELELKRKKFIEEGGSIDDFQVQPDILEEKIKVLLKQYRDQKTEFNKSKDLEKKDNLQLKYEVIEKIKELINRKESINKTFNEFRDLQREWRFIGLVPQQNLKDLWDTYNHHVEKFYDYIKINKELRDLDLKKNLELKMQLCERAEELILESSVINAFNSLQKYHERWREIGPVPLEVRNEIWERFREATAKVNKRHQEHFEGLKKEQKNNLNQKVLLCEKAEEISNEVLETHRQWDEKSKELIEIQKVWKSIGFAPKKDNNKIYERFRKACDAFFNRKREFYAQSKELQMNNLQLKTDLCVQAESLKESTEWKKTTEDLINLQKKWKEVGPVPKKYSETVWRRFRAACDDFFKKKSEYYQNIDQTYTKNLEEKKKLLKEVESMTLSDNVEENFKALNEYQRKWSEIGFVPFKEKEALQENFRKAINKHFDNLDINDSRKNLLKFRNKLSNINQKPRADFKIGQERERYLTRLQQLNSDIVLWENNIGFFAKSKNAEAMISEVQSKIDKAKEAMKLLEDKINLIDNM